VRDASEQNGMVKLEWYREKAELLVWKFECNLPCVIRPEDGCPCSTRSFTVNNKKACSVRGWFPPNRKLLDHPLLQSVTTSAASPATSVPPLPPPTLNVDSGLASSCLDALMRDRARSDGARKAAEKRKLESDSIEENIAKSQRLTGVLTQNGVHSLNDPSPRFLDPFRQRQTDVAKKLEEKATKTKALRMKRYDEVKALRAKYGGEKSHLFQTWTMAECSSYLQYKKKLRDPAKMFLNNARNASNGCPVHLPLPHRATVTWRTMIAIL
jgi:hypothetical protein